MGNPVDRGAVALRCARFAGERRQCLERDIVWPLNGFMVAEWRGWYAMKSSQVEVVRFNTQGRELMPEAEELAA
jgi:hypothetical protein